MELLEARRKLLGPSDEDSEGNEEDEEGGTEAEDQDQDDADMDRVDDAIGAAVGENGRVGAERGDEGEDDARGGTAWEEQHVVQGGARRTALVVSHGNPSPPIAGTVSQEDAETMYSAGLEMELHLQRDEREISLLKDLLVEQERQVRALFSLPERCLAY